MRIEIESHILLLNVSKAKPQIFIGIRHNSSPVEIK